MLTGKFTSHNTRYAMWEIPEIRYTKLDRKAGFLDLGYFRVSGALELAPPSD